MIKEKKSVGGGHVNYKVFNLHETGGGGLLELLFSFHKRQDVRERMFQNRPEFTQSKLAPIQDTNYCSHSLNVPKS